MNNIKELEIKYNCIIEDEEVYGETFYTACIEDNGMDRFCYAFGHNLEDLEISIIDSINNINECD